MTEPIPISLIAGHYLLFDADVVTYLRRAHNICGVLIGTIPQVPQQNVFLGLPVELLPEEAKLLVQSDVAYIIDDAAWHKQKFSNLQGADRKKYRESLRLEGRKAQKVAENDGRRRAARGLAKQALLRASKEELLSNSIKGPESSNTVADLSDDEDSALFDSKVSPSPTSELSRSSGYSVTPTTSYSPSSLPETSLQQPDPAVPISYPLFAHLHEQKYFITPGLRFGCDYSVYPGDPLRFHSHFLAVGHDWDEEIPLMDLVGGGRLGTGVKKGFLIGGESRPKSVDDAAKVRTFCIEWGGM